METAFVTCPLCEATCGLAVTHEDGQVLHIRGDQDDVFSRGYLCPKGTSLGALHSDPDRLRAPLVKRAGEFHEATWDEAFAVIAERLPALRVEYGADAVAVYFGNPSAHTLSGALYLRVLGKALATRNVYSAGTVDQIPRVFAAGYLYGDPATVPVPDLDRTDYLLVLGANPLVSNGSVMTAPDMRGRLKRIRQRGGKVVVVDPARTRTTDRADEHVAVRPGSDALLLFALLNVILEESRAHRGSGSPPGEARRGPAPGEAVHAGGSGRPGWRRRGRRTAPGSRARGGGAGRCVRTHGHHDDIVRHGRQLADRRPERRDR